MIQWLVWAEAVVEWVAAEWVVVVWEVVNHHQEQFKCLNKKWMLSIVCNL